MDQGRNRGGTASYGYYVIVVAVEVETTQRCWTGAMPKLPRTPRFFYAILAEERVSSLPHPERSSLIAAPIA